MKRKSVILLWLLCLLALPLSAQTGKAITMTFQNESLSSVFKKLEKVSDYKFLFAYDDVKPYTVTGSVKNLSFRGTMDYVLSGKPLEYTIDGNIVNIALTSNAPAQEALKGGRTVKGRVVDQQGEPLPGVTVSLKGTKAIVVTDANGNYSIQIPKEGTLLYSFVGMTDRTRQTKGRNNINVAPG